MFDQIIASIFDTWQMFHSRIDFVFKLTIQQTQNFSNLYPFNFFVAWAIFIEIDLNRSVSQPLASSREFSWRCSLSTPVVDSHRCCWLITPFSSRPRVRNCLHFINLLNCQEDPNKPKLWVALWINCNQDSYFSEAGGYNCNTTHFILRYWNRR